MKFPHSNFIASNQKRFLRLQLLPMYVRSTVVALVMESNAYIPIIYLNCINLSQVTPFQCLLANFQLELNDCHCQWLYIKLI